MSIDQAMVKELKQEHTQFSEEVEVANLSLPYIYGEVSDLKKTMNFVEKISAHISKEEKLFNIVLIVGNLEMKQITRDLQVEHIQILRQFDIMKDIILKHGYSFTEEKIKDLFVSALKSYIELHIFHAKKEDEEFFPYFKDKKVVLSERDLGL